MKQINDLPKSNLTTIWLNYIKDYISKNNNWKLVYDENWIVINYHSLEMWYSLLELSWISKEEDFEKILENFIDKDFEDYKFPKYIWNLYQNWKYYIILREDHIWNYVILFNWKLLSLIK